MVNGYARGSKGKLRTPAVAAADEGGAIAPVVGGACAPDSL